MTEEDSHTTFILDFGKMDIKELESKHLLSHLNKNLELHNLILQELNNRKFSHIYLDTLDREQEWLIQDWKTYDASKMTDQVLLDDHRIVSAWLITLRTGKRFESPQFKDQSLDEQIEIVSDLEEEIHAEMEDRGFKIDSLELVFRNLEVQKRGANPSVKIEYSKEYSFVLHRHYGDQIKSHFDLRWKITDTHKQEMNIYKDPTRARVGEKIFARFKNIADEDPKNLAMWMVTEGDHLLRRIGPLETYIDCLDSGTLDIIGFSDNFISMKINGKFLKGYFVARKDKNGWSFIRTNTAMKEPLLSSETINESDSDRHD
jgi:hypothetical protein